MRVSNMTSDRGNTVANQFLIKNVTVKIGRKNYTGTMFQSYNSLIAFRTNEGDMFLDEYYWDYSRTTSKYLRQFTGKYKAETVALIDAGVYKLADLNKGA